MAPGPAESAELFTQLADLRTTHNVPVMAVSLITPRAAHSGKLTVRTKVWGAQPDIHLRWGSITKTITALTVLALAEDEKIDLHAPLARYVDPGHWHNPWRATHPIRVNHLLELTAGLPDLSSREFNFNSPVSLTQALAINPRHRTTRWPPGLQHVYSNMTPGLSQLLIETVAQQSFARAAEKWTFAPLGMRSAGFSPQAPLPGGFKADGKTPIPYWHMTFPAYGALNASIDDLVLLTTHLISIGRKHGSSPLFQARSSLAGQNGLAHTYAAGLYPRVRNGLVWHGHGGDADGYRSRMAFIPEAQLGYVVNINVDNPRLLARIEALLETHLSQNVPADKPPPTPSPGTSSAGKFHGTYYPSGARFGLDRWQAGTLTRLHVTSMPGGTLRWQRGKQGGTLLPVTSRLYRRPADPRATVIFIEEGGRIYLQGELGNYARIPCPAYMQTIPGCREPASP